MKKKEHKWRNCSQAQQDRWAFDLIGDNGTYIEIGGHLPVEKSNTYNLEVGHNWKGFSVEIDRKYKPHWDECIERTSKIYWADAMTFNYNDAAKLNNLPSRINYLSIDIEPPENTFKALKKVINDGFVFDLITFEHDRYYQLDKDYHKIACDFLLPKGYKIAVENVWHKKEKRQFETWFVHQDIEHQHMTFNKWLKRVKKIITPKKTEKETCSVCAKTFQHQKPDTLVGMLGIIPVQFCKKCFPRVMAQSEELKLNDTRLKVV